MKKWLLVSVMMIVSFQGLAESKTSTKSMQAERRFLRAQSSADLVYKNVLTGQSTVIAKLSYEARYSDDHTVCIIEFSKGQLPCRQLDGNAQWLMGDRPGDVSYTKLKSPGELIRIFSLYADAIAPEFQKSAVPFALSRSTDVFRIGEMLTQPILFENANPPKIEMPRGTNAFLALGSGDEFGNSYGSSYTRSLTIIFQSQTQPSIQLLVVPTIGAIEHL